MIIFRNNFFLYNKIMFNLFIHNVFLPLSPPMYNRKVLKAFILNMWLFAVYYLFCRSFIDMGTKVPILAISVIFFCTSIILNSQILTSRRYSKLINWYLFLSYNFFVFFLSGLIYYFGFFTFSKLNQSVDFIYKMISTILLVCFVGYIIQNFNFLNKKNLLIPSTNLYIQQTKTTQFLIGLLLALYAASNWLYFFNITPVYNVLNASILIFIFVFLNFQLYKRFMSNNISLFPLIYKYRNSISNR
jgi:hypothetical protein